MKVPATTGLARAPAEPPPLRLVWPTVDVADLGAVVAGFRANGHVVVRGVVPLDVIDTVCSDIAEVFALQARRLGVAQPDDASREQVLAVMQRVFDYDVSLWLAGVRHAARLASVQRMALDASMMRLLDAFGMVAPTLPTTPVLHVMADTLRVPGGYHGLAAHQDWPSIQGALDSVAVWAPLYDVAEDGFPVELIPDSHRHGLWPGQTTHAALEVDPSSFTDSDFVRVALNRGDAILFSGFTVHRSAVAGCHGLRLATSTRYEDSAEPTFVERAWPCAYRRTVERALLQPGFPSAAQVGQALAPRPARNTP